MARIFTFRFLFYLAIIVLLLIVLKIYQDSSTLQASERKNVLKSKRSNVVIENDDTLDLVALRQTNLKKAHVHVFNINAPFSPIFLYKFIKCRSSIKYYGVKAILCKIFLIWCYEKSFSFNLSTNLKVFKV